MIKSFRSKGLAELWSKDHTSKIDRRIHERVFQRLDALDAAEKVADMDVPGFDFHSLRGVPRRYTIHINGPWCLTFEFLEGDAYRVDFEQYH